MPTYVLMTKLSPDSIGDAADRKVSLISREQGAISAESWPALSYEKHLKLMEEVTRGKNTGAPAGKPTT